MEWGSADEYALADAHAQLAHAIRRGDTARAAELQDHINSLMKRKHNDADEDAYQL
jgi:protein-arginine kinase activator protein McsA